VASYYVYSGAAGSANGSSWANAYTTLTAAFTGKAAGDIFYVAHDHAESSTGVTLAGPGTSTSPIKIVCVNRAGSVPPVSADRRNTAQVVTTAANNININGWAHYDGVIFSAGTGTSSAANIILFGASYQWLRFDNCSFRFPITGSSGGNLYVGGGGGTFGGTLLELNNTTMSFAGASASSSAILLAGTMRWRNTPGALLLMNNTAGLVTPITAAKGVQFECVGVDLSAVPAAASLVNMSTSAVQGGRVVFLDCKLNAAATKMQSRGGVAPYFEVDFVRSGASGVNYNVYSWRIGGDLNEETTIVRSGGASDGITPLSWKIVTAPALFCNFSFPFECPKIAIWCDTVGSVVTATVEGVWGGGAVPNDDEIWLDVEYLGSSSSPQGSFVSDGKADLLTAAAGQASSSASWNGSTTKFKLDVTFTPQQKGWVYARVKCAKASSTFYIDPLVTLT
jgi:hypothetical protein